MNRLVASITKYVEHRVRSVAGTLEDESSALRTVFHGPPEQYVRQVLDRIIATGGLDAELRDGTVVRIPVLLPLERLPAGVSNPRVGDSGECDESHLLALRNTPACPRYLTLAPPARQSILSLAQAVDAFGLLPEHNGASASIDDWWRDPFVQFLVDEALERHDWRTEKERQGARQLLEEAVRSANEVDKHDPHRLHAWAVLSRVHAIASGRLPFAEQWSLACGFPSIGDDSLNDELQVKTLHTLADALLDDGYAPTAARLGEHANEEEQRAIDDCLHYLRRSCDVPLELKRSICFYYGPFREEKLGDPPAWWEVLTASRLAELLEREDKPVGGALSLSCEDSLLQSALGLPIVVAGPVKLVVRLPEDAEQLTASVLRDAPGRGNKREWELNGDGARALTDTQVPAHDRPLKYVASAGGLKKSAIRVISLESWVPGIVVAGRSVSKLSLPKKAKVATDADYECDVTLSGEGRHFLDVFTSPGVELERRAVGTDTSSAGAERLEAVIAPPPEDSTGAWGMEVVATTECRYDLEYTTADGKSLVLRLNFACDDVQTEGCSSEFERLLRLNRPGERGIAGISVQVDRQVRVADLQDWILDPQSVDHSYYPMVLGPDARDSWRQPSWDVQKGSVMSRGEFLHDPRPSLAEMLAPQDFLEARRPIAARIRGDDHGLIEAAEFGVWLADKEFAEQVDAYVRSYMVWLSNEPDVAAWADVILVTGLEGDGQTLSLEPDALIVSPLHPIRVGWHALAQRTLLDSARAGYPCPAASVLDPDALPDALALPLRTAAGAIKRVTFLAVECGSDYWAVLWNGARLGRLTSGSPLPPFDAEFGLKLGGVSSGFSSSQVKRALDDVSSLLTAKPIINTVIARSAGQSDACNDGLLEWARERFGEGDGSEPTIFSSLGPRALHVFDERGVAARPESASIANLAEDTAGAVRWYAGVPQSARPDLGIIAQLETSNAEAQPVAHGTPLGYGALIRHRVRKQLVAGAGAFLSESRMGIGGPPTGDALADHVASAVALIENLGEDRYGYTFAPSVQAIRDLFNTRNTEYVAVSSSSVDPACFLGGWLDGVYLWDYELPSYSHRAGDTNGYYLLSRIKGLDCESLQDLLQRLPDCADLDDQVVRNILLEVSRRGMPTVRGLSAGHSGAAGDLGLFLAGRLLQDDFRDISTSEGGLLSVLASDGTSHEVSLVIPVDPFRGYLVDLQRATQAQQFLRPDLVVAGITISDSTVCVRLTPVEVKQRQDPMPPAAQKDALAQAAALSALLERVKELGTSNGLTLWRLAFDHLVLSMLDFGFRVYSQQVVARKDPDEWTRLHQRVAEAVLAGTARIEVNTVGRLIIFDGSSSTTKDVDGDGFDETIVIDARDASQIIKGGSGKLLGAIRSKLGDWSLFPERHAGVASTAAIVPANETATNQSLAHFSRDTSIQDRAQELKDEDRGSRSLPVSDTGLPPDEIGDGITSVNFPARTEALGARLDSTAQTGEANPESYAAAVAVPPSVQESRASNDGMRVLVGHAAEDFRAEPQYLRPGMTKLNQLNIGVVGDLGTGKTQLIKSLVYQMRSASSTNAGVQPRFLILDYKRDYGADDFLQAVGGKVVSPFQLPLNLFDTSGAPVPTGMPPWMPRFRFFADVLGKIYSGIGPVQLNNLKAAVKGSYEGAVAVGRQPTIYDVYDRYKATVQGRADTPLSIISDMVDMELFSRHPTEATAFDKFFDGVVVIALDQLGSDDRTKNMVVAIMLNMFYEYMLRLPKRPYRGVDPQLRTVDSYLLVDEAENIMKYEFDVLKTLLLQGREFGVGVILASQYLKHFKTGATDYREPLLSWFLHKVPNVTAQELTALGMPGSGVQLAARVQQLENHYFLYKTFDVTGTVVRGMPFYQLIGTQPES